MKTIKRLFWTFTATLGIAAATAGPSFAGAAFNHTELLTTANSAETEENSP